MKHLSKLIVAILLASCASRQPVAENSKHWDMRVVMSASQTLNLEPCGCSLAPRGGISREWNYLEKLRNEDNGEVVFLTSGVSFFNSPHDPEIPVEQQRLKAGALVQAWNKMGMKVMGVEAADLQLDAKTMESLKSDSKFDWVSTNIPGYKEYSEVKASNGSLLVLSVSKPSKGIATKDPIESVRRVLSGLPKTDPNRVVVVLSSLSPAEEERLMKAIPEIQILSRSEAEYLPSVSQQGKSQILFSPESGGKSLARVDLQFQQKAAGFYNPVVAEIHARNVAAVERMLTSSETKKSEKAQLKADRELSSQVPKANAPDLVVYDSDVSRLSRDFEGTPNENPMEKLLQKYHEDVSAL